MTTSAAKANRNAAIVERLEAEIERLTAAQWPMEATAEMKAAVYALNLGENRLSEDDVIDIYDTFRRIVLEQSTRER